MENPYDQSEVQESLNIIKAAMQADGPSEPGSYAHGWHCNIAMACYDAIREALDEVPHEQALLVGNESATRFMKLCFDLDTKA